MNFSYDTSDTDGTDDSTEDTAASKSKRFSGSNVAGRIELPNPHAARRNTYNHRRQIGAISAFGTCTFPGGAEVTQPPFPQAKVVKTWEKVKGGKEKTEVLPGISRWWVRSGGCGSDWGVQKVDTATLGKTEVSSDHVCMYLHPSKPLFNMC